MRKGYYDVEIDVEGLLTSTGSLDSYFYLQDLKQRKLALECDVDAASIPELVHHILQFNKEDEGLPVEDRKPILLYISSNGGSVYDGFALIDAIEASVTPVYTVNLGYAFSMGFLIALAGHKRYAMRNAKYLMHDGTSFVWDSGSKAQDQMEFNKQVEKRVKEYILAKTAITSKEYDKQLRREWYMFADEAKRCGVVDSIIGEDCALSEVI